MCRTVHLQLLHWRPRPWVDGWMDGSRAARPPSRPVINDLRSSSHSHGNNESLSLSLSLWWSCPIPHPSAFVPSRTSGGPRLSLQATKLAFNPAFLFFLFALTLRSKNGSSLSLSLPRLLPLAAIANGRVDLFDLAGGGARARPGPLTTRLTARQLPIGLCLGDERR